MKLMRFQGKVLSLWKKFGLLLLLWRRQAGKTTTFAWIGLRLMLEYPGCLVTFVSASLSVGGEVTARVASLFWQILQEVRYSAGKRGIKIESNADGLSESDYIDMFQSGRLEVKVWHSKTRCSRMKVIAPNPATARGYTGFVLMDEVGWIPQFRELWDAVEWIAARDPEFRVLMATTPPEDDTHFSYELSVPPDGTEFKPDAEGTLYISQAGVQVHRVDVWDAALAGVKIYDTRTREEVSPEDSRARALDKQSWDRNMALRFIAGGTAAMSLMTLSQAMQAGKDVGVCEDGGFPDDWESKLGPGQYCVGVDVATTEGQKSNPSSIAIVEKFGILYITRLVIRYKTAANEQALAMIRKACNPGNGRRPRRVVIDGSNERYFADMVKKSLYGVCPVQIIAGGDRHPHEDMNMKTYCGNRLVNMLDEHRITLPESGWLKEDFRLVFKERGAFVNHLDAAGNHADTFDAVKLALHGFDAGGPVGIEAAGPSTSPSISREWGGEHRTMTA